MVGLLVLCKVKTCSFRSALNVTLPSIVLTRIYFLLFLAISILSFNVNAGMKDITVSHDLKFTGKLNIDLIRQKNNLPDSVILMPDGQNLFTIQKDQLTLFSLSPLKKIKSFKLPYKTPQNRFINRYQAFISEDSKHLILCFNSQIKLFDIYKNLIKEITTIDFKQNFVVTMVRDKLITIDEQGLLSEWNIYDLKKTRELKLPFISDLSITSSHTQLYRLPEYFLLIGIDAHRNREIIALFEPGTYQLKKLIEKFVRTGINNVVLLPDDKTLLIKNTSAPQNWQSAELNLETLSLNKSELLPSDFPSIWEGSIPLSFPSRYTRWNEQRNLAVTSNLKQFFLMSYSESKNIRVWSDRAEIYMPEKGEIIMKMRHGFKLSSPHLRKYFRVEKKDGTLAPLSDLGFKKIAIDIYY